jgi:hypothetical protein
VKVKTEISTNTQGAKHRQYYCVHEAACTCIGTVQCRYYAMYSYVHLYSTDKVPNYLIRYIYYISYVLYVVICEKVHFEQKSRFQYI